MKGYSEFVRAEVSLEFALAMRVAHSMTPQVNSVRVEGPFLHFQNVENRAKKGLCKKGVQKGSPIELTKTSITALLRSHTICL